jgi:hypothetical protein
LGEMGSRKSIPKLRKALDDKDPRLLAAAHALHLMKDNSSYAVYYEVLTRQRKGARSLISSQTSTLSDPKKMAQLGFEGVGFRSVRWYWVEGHQGGYEGRLIPSTRRVCPGAG